MMFGRGLESSANPDLCPGVGGDPFTFTVGIGDVIAGYALARRTGGFLPLISRHRFDDGLLGMCIGEQRLDIAVENQSISYGSPWTIASAANIYRAGN